MFVGEHALRNIIPALIASPYFNIVGLFFRSHRPKLVDQFKMYTIYNDYSEGLADSRVDCVYISSPNKYHFTHSYEALKHNKHVICEKPLASRYDQVAKLIKLSQVVEKCIFEAFMFEHHQQFIELKSLLYAQKVGEVLTWTSRFGFPHLKVDDIRYKKYLDGGAFFDCACYLIKAAHLILGDNYKSIKGNVTYQDGYEVDTGGVCLIEYMSGQTAFLDWGMGRNYINEVDIWTDIYRVKVERVFSKSPDFDSSIVKVNSNGGVNSIEIGKMNHFIAMFEQFHQVINSNSYTEHLLKLESYQRFFFAVHNSLFEKEYE